MSSRLHKAHIVALALIAGLIPYACTNVLDTVSPSGYFDLELAKAHDGKLNQETRARLTLSAEKLGARFMREHDPTRPEIPIEVIDFFYNGLVHIANSELKAAKQVTKTYEIEAWQPGDPRELLVFTNSTPAWTDAWEDGNTWTGNSVVDSLMNRYGLSLHRYHEFYASPGAAVQLRSNKAWNMHAVGGRFMAEIAEIDAAGFNIPVALPGTPSDIKAEATSDYLEYTFTFPFGSNLAFTRSRHTWIFRVFPNGSVQLESEWGDPLP